MQFDPSASRSMQNALPGTRPALRPRRPWLHLLSALLELAGGKAELLRHEEKGWASVTFTGSRHTVALAFAGAEAVAAGEAFLDAIPEHEFRLPRQLVADAAVTEAIHTALPEPRLEVTVELLVLDEG